MRGIRHSIAFSGWGSFPLGKELFTYQKNKHYVGVYKGRVFDILLIKSKIFTSMELEKV